MKKELIYKAKMDDVLASLKESIFYNFNSHKLGIIEKVNAAQMTATIKLVYKVEQDANTVTHPLLVNCPLHMPVSDAGGLQIPMNAGDTCLVLFNDNDIDTWFTTGETDTLPSTTRLHNINDGIALVGVKSLSNVITDYSTTRTKLNYQETSITLDDLVDIKNEQSNMKAVFQTIIDAITKIKGYTDLPVAPNTAVAASPMSAVLTDADIQAISDEINKLLK
tara:strand:+ start:1180 stop:1845 length:666 start_codon:yes stop_codon:yes gene_type:complete